MLIMKSMLERKKILPLVLALANSIIKKLGFVEIINQSVSWDPLHWSVTPGELAKILVLSTFFELRTPLTHLEDRLEEIDIDFFLETSSQRSNVNSFNVGRALERIGKADYETIYETLAFSALYQYQIPTERLHADTTTISFSGEYDIDLSTLTSEEQEEYLAIERGYNKDGRPQDKQVVVGEIVNEVGIPIGGKTMDGSTADTTWNTQAVHYLKCLQEKGFSYGIFVADSKLMTQELLCAMNEEKNTVCFVSRCPTNFAQKLEERMIRKAYQTENWEDFGRFHQGKQATCYQGQSFWEEVYGHSMRLIVLKSSILQEKAEEKLEKKQKELEPKIKAMEKKRFRCEADAQEEVQRFCKEKEMRWFVCNYEIEKSVKEQWPRGRRGKETKPKREESYQIKVTECQKQEQACQKFLEKESCIVLISNAAETYGDRELLKIYKGQQVVENSFRELKHPSMASVIYLKHPQRIQALSMLLRFALLVRAIIQYKLREGLREYEEQEPNQVLAVGWGNRPLKNPTYRLFYEHSVNCYFEREGNGDYSFAWPTVETKERVSVLLQLLGVELSELIE